MSLILGCEVEKQGVAHETPEPSGVTVENRSPQHVDRPFPTFELAGQGVI
ncbi:hypothetical protein [Aureliella helgolandensis]|nr:hypothetical protein [Aureliella helgolandensis]